MAKQSKSYLWYVLAALVLGSLFGALVFSNHTVEYKDREIIKEVEVPVEVETIVETLVNAPEDLRDQAFEDFWEYLDKEDLFICDEEEYSESEVELVKFYDPYSLEFDEDEYTVYFSAKLKFKESDLRSCRNIFDVSVFYEEGEEPEVTIL